MINLRLTSGVSGGNFHDRRMHGWKEGWKDAWRKEVWLEGRKDAWKEGRKNEYTNKPIDSINEAISEPIR